VNAKGRQVAGPSTRFESLSPRGDGSPALSALEQRWDELGFNPFASDGDHSWPQSNGLARQELEPKSRAELPAEERLRGTPLEETRSSVRAFPLRGTSSRGSLREFPLRGKRAHPSTPAVQQYRRSKGRHGKISGPELGRWSYRLASEQGLLVLETPPADPLPAHMPPLVAKTWRGFLLLVACAWTHTYGIPVGFERRFAASWCEITEDEARMAIDLLRDSGYMIERGRSGHLRLWLPKGAP
jgi:hypothetical protein